MSAVNFKLTVEYDGTDFRGWQKQPEERTVQGVIEEALLRIIGAPVAVHGAGRTDAGVHAVGQVCSFRADTKLEPERLHRALNGALPRDVLVRECKVVPESFHARFSALSRSYSFFLRTEPTALWRRYFHVVNFVPDLNSMRRAASYLIGEKDFASFAASSKEDRFTVCRVRRLEIRRSGVVIAFHIEADRFLHKMVRTVVGTLLEVGKGRISPKRIEEILDRKDRRSAGPTLAPNGLFLVDVAYRNPK